MKIFQLIFLFSGIFLTAQNSDMGNWMMYFGNQRIANSWNWHNEVQYRNYDAVGDLEQLLLRTGIGYNFDQSSDNVLIGYAFVHSQKYMDDLNDEKESFNEHRLFEQLIMRHNIGRVFIQHRYRVEQRFIDDQDFSNRFRYFLLLNIPLNQNNLTKNSWYLSAYNEVFINANQTLFDRNRLYGALGYSLSDYVRVEAGFMQQMFQNVDNRTQFQIGIYNNLPFYTAKR